MPRLILIFLFLVSACATTSTPVLHEADFARVKIGMTQPEVRQILGQPTQMESFPLMHQVAWTYDFRDLWGYFAYTSVMFNAEGHVVGKVNTRKEPEDQ